MTRKQGIIHSESFGSGPDVVLVHGWGMHSGVWRGFAQKLAHEFRVTLIDLPGHGRSGMIDDYDLNGVGLALMEQAPAKAHWLGWSLGSMCALSLASRFSERMASLTMMAGNARFAQGDDWPCAMDLQLMSRFANDLITDYHKTLMQFIGLQTWGLDHAREVLRDLKAHVAECDEPEEAALRAGLDILRTEDLRSLLPNLPVSLLLLLGSKDRLAPPASGLAMQALSGRAELQVLEGAAHTPFLSHGNECVERLTDFWQRNDGSTDHG